MKRNIAIALFGLASLVAASGAFAQSGSTQANVPFAFSVSNTVLPAGHYQIAGNNYGASILIRNVEQGRSIISTTLSSEKASAGTCELVFHRYGERYFLNQVLCPSKSLSVDLPITGREKRARMMEEARGPVEGTVLVAMR